MSEISFDDFMAVDIALEKLPELSRFLKQENLHINSG
jgi:hypothetical protein